MTRIFYYCKRCDERWCVDVKSMGLFGNWWKCNRCGRKIEPGASEKL